VAGSAIRAVRGRGRSPLPPAAILATIWNQREYPRFVPYLKRLDVLAETPDELLVYEQVAMPLVAADRDYTIRLRRTTSPDGRIEVAFASAAADGPPEDDSHVRVRTISGSWVIEPDPGGGSRATYTVQSDPGGSIPAWLVNRLQVTVIARFVGAVLTRAAARHGEP
jgi:ribosome-associated toxin RatA of RatAB toxin-antitoxin module